MKNEVWADADSTRPNNNPDLNSEPEIDDSWKDWDALLDSFGQSREKTATNCKQPHDGGSSEWDIYLGDFAQPLDDDSWERDLVVDPFEESSDTIFERNDGKFVPFHGE